MRKIKLILSLIICLSLILFGVTISFAIKTSRGMSFSIHDFKSSNYSYPSFRFYIKAPDGNIIGWSESSSNWTGTVKESVIEKKTFHYPDPSQECTSSEEYKDIRFNFSSGIRGNYAVNNTLYCKSEKGEDIFISSGYGGNIGNTPDGKYEIVLIPYKYGVVNFCYDFIVENEEEFNIHCTNDDYTKQLLITPDAKQTIEVTYNYKDRDSNSMKKVVSSSLITEEWEGCYQLGMIKNQGIYTSIKQKLENAKKKAESGNTKTA